LSSKNAKTTKTNDRHTTAEKNSYENLKFEEIYKG